MVKIQVEDYEACGLGDIYYGLISFMTSYVNKNFDPLEGFTFDGSSQTKYSIAMDIMKTSIKELLDYMKNKGEVYLPQYNKSVNIDFINMEEQLAIEERCKEYMILKLNEYFTELDLNINSHNRRM